MDIFGYKIDMAKNPSLDIFGYKIDIFLISCFIALFFQCFTVLNRGFIVTLYLLFVVFSLFYQKSLKLMHAGSTIFKKTEILNKRVNSYIINVKIVKRLSLFFEKILARIYFLAGRKRFSRGFIFKAHIKKFFIVRFNFLHLFLYRKNLPEFFRKLPGDCFRHVHLVNVRK